MPPKISKNRLYDLLREMVNIYSPTGKEIEIAEFLATYLHENDLPVTMREVSDGRRNVEVILGKTPPEIAFIGHIDTVPAFDIENFEFDPDGDLIYGLGTADMKSGCAAMIEAFISLTRYGKKLENVGLFLVVGEEENGDGTAALLDAMTFPYAIVAEPTNLRPCLGHYGYIEMLIQAYGKRRHASMANPKYNAIFSTLQTLHALADLLQSKHPQTVMNIRSLQSSQSGFAVPSSCEAWIDLHIKPTEDTTYLIQQLTELAENHLSGSAVTNREIHFPTLAPGYQLSPDEKICQITKHAFQTLSLPYKSSTFTSHSDANLLRQANCSPIILGPGTLARAHTRDEAVSFQQTIDAAKIYQQILLTTTPF